MWAAGLGINQGGIDNLFQFSDSLSWIRHSHTLKFGADIRYVRFDERLGLSNNGAFTFDDRYTGNPVSDFLLGNTAAMTAQIGLGVGRWRSNSWNFFVADDWKITSRLTLNLGLRYEYDTPYYERDGKEGYFDTSLQKFVVGIRREDSPIKRDIPGIEYRAGSPPGRLVSGSQQLRSAGRACVSDQRLASRYARDMACSMQRRRAMSCSSRSTLRRSSSRHLWWAPSASRISIGIVTHFPIPHLRTFPVGTLAPFSVDPRDRTPYLHQWNSASTRRLLRICCWR